MFPEYCHESAVRFHNPNVLNWYRTCETVLKISICHCSIRCPLMCGKLQYHQPHPLNYHTSLAGKIDREPILCTRKPIFILFEIESPSQPSYLDNFCVIVSKYWSRPRIFHIVFIWKGCLKTLQKRWGLKAHVRQCDHCRIQTLFWQSSWLLLHRYR